MLNRFSKKIKTIIIVVLIVALAVLIIPLMLSLGQKGVTVSEASLKKAVEISKLSTAEFSYHGIAEKLDDNGNVAYHIYYEATADAGIDMADTNFDIDYDEKNITITIPEITIDNPVVDESAMDYLPNSANVDLREVLEICKADMQNEIANSPKIKQIATANVKTTIEALLLPIIKSEGYTISWKEFEDVEQLPADDGNQDNVENGDENQEGANSENA